MKLGFFELKTAVDLLNKLEHDYQRMKNRPTCTYAAFDFFVTAEHMIEWQYPDLDRNGRTQYRKLNPILRVVSQLANGAKHFGTDKPHHKSVKDTSCKNVGGFAYSYTYGHKTYGFDCLVVDLSEEAESAYGCSVDSLTLAKDTLSFWRKDMEMDEGAAQ